MRSSMIVALLSTFVASAVFGSATSTSAQDETTTTTTTQQTVPVEPKKCVVSQVVFSRYARKVYERTKIRSNALRKLDLMRACAKTIKANQKMLQYQHQLGQSRQIRKRATALTPYPGPNGTYWAIPWRIVACESGGSWSAYNPSGASGPYQLLGHGAPMPADTPEKRLLHHKIAANLWDGGAGASQWVCR